MFIQVGYGTKIFHRRWVTEPVETTFPRGRRCGRRNTVRGLYGRIHRFGFGRRREFGWLWGDGGLR
jgi:hypothetical protein